MNAPSVPGSRTRVADLLGADGPRDRAVAKGWVRTRREAKGVAFIELNDGSCLANLQLVVDAGTPAFAVAEQLRTGASVSATGSLVESPGAGQKWELHVESLELIGDAAGDYPLQKKRHGDEFLRTIAHLRPRTNKYGAVFRIRSRLAQAIHEFFRERRFVYVHTPIITGSDCEGAGEMFQVTTLDLGDVPKTGGRVDYDQDFFAKEAKLTVSGQLSVETFCLALADVYTFGPTFRSENSNTSRHMSEFWMIEPEMAFAELADDIALAEAFVKHLLEVTLADCAEDLALFDRFVEKGLIEKLRHVHDSRFERVSYTDAIDILVRSERKFEFPVAWGSDLQSEHERFLTEEYFKRPTVVYDYPRDIKAFYMRQNDDNRTVAALDLLVPGIGELIGGSQREDREDLLRQRIEALGFDPADYWWYLDTRRYGSVPHAGFGLGFERLLMFVTGVGNIRDVIPFPRTPRHLEF